MIVLLDTPEKLDVCEREIGVRVNQLFTPLTRYNPQRPDEEFACDNGGYSRFDRDGFLAMLRKHEPRKKLCRFVAAPDVVANARRTLEAFRFWQYELTGWPLALVAQDGLEDLEIPWRSIEAVFIGGSTDWKLSKHAADVIRAAKICGKWVHAGRVNTPGRFEYFEALGADSIDGTGLSRYTWMRKRIYDKVHNPDLFTEAVA